MREVNALSRMSHSSIVRYYTVSELMALNDLFHHEPSRRGWKLRLDPTTLAQQAMHSAFSNPKGIPSRGWKTTRIRQDPVTSPKMEIATIHSTLAWDLIPRYPSPEDQHSLGCMRTQNPPPAIQVLLSQIPTMSQLGRGLGHPL
jgi:hypothetical protein